MIFLVSNINSLSKQYCYPPIPRNGGCRWVQDLYTAIYVRLPTPTTRKGKTDLKWNPHPRSRGQGYIMYMYGAYASAPISYKNSGARSSNLLSTLCLLPQRENGKCRNSFRHPRALSKEKSAFILQISFFRSWCNWATCRQQWCKAINHKPASRV